MSTGTSCPSRRRSCSGTAIRRLARIAVAGLLGSAIPALIGAPRASGARPALGVGLTSCTFRDPSRSTYDYATGATVPGRTLPTEIRYPASADPAGPGSPQAAQAAAPPARGEAPYPTIFFASGYDVTPDVYTALLDAWVRAGFVVIAPEFPDTGPAAVAAARTGDPEDDVVNQPADMAFVISQVLAMTRAAATGCRVLRGLVAPGEIGVAGQSDGGETVAALAYDRAAGFASLDRGLGIRADAVLSGSEIGAGPYHATVGDPALLVVQSSTDQCNPPQDSTALYEAVIQRDRWFLDIHDADHLPPYTGEDGSAFAVVARVTERFFSMELVARSEVAGFLAYANTAPLVASLSTGPEAPPIAPLEQAPAACYLG